MTAPHEQGSRVREPADRWTTLLLLNFVTACSVGEMGLMSILVEPIRLEYHLSDAAVTMVISIVYAVFVISASVPMGVLTDRGSRKLVIAGAATFSGLMFAMPSLGPSLVLLALSRMGLGIAHAAYSPPAASLLADKFAPERRPMAMSLLIMGSCIGAWVAISGGGHIANQYGWRSAVLAVGVVTLIAAACVFFGVREPVRGAMDDPIVRAAAAQKSTFREAIATAWKQKAVRNAIMGNTLMSFWGYGLIWWVPAFLNRSFGVSVGEAGAMLGPIHGVVGVTGVLISSLLLSRLAKGDPRRPLWLVFGLTLLCTLPSIAMVLMNSAAGVVLMAWLYLPILYIAPGPAMATVTSCLPPQMRGQVMAVYACGTNVFSLAIAPMAIGVLSDAIAPHIANPAESLRYALFPLALAGFWSAAHFFLASRHVREDMARLSAGELTPHGAAPPAGAASAGQAAE